jgi:galactokinase
MLSAVVRILERAGDPSDLRWFRAPGRVNLIGEHTDYNEGFVLPIAIDRDCIVAARPAATTDVDSLDEDLVRDDWTGLVAAVSQELSALGRPDVGMEAIVASDVPIGAGLSSSAAFEVACAVALARLAEWQVDPARLAEACRRAEERATGVPCGIMDQLIVVCGREGCALLIDCRSLEKRAVPLPEGLSILAVHSGQERTLAASAYAERRRACEALAAELGVPALRDATPEQVADDPLGRHVVSENGRVLEAVKALENGELGQLGRLMNESHASLRDDYRVSTPELDALVDSLVEAGALGARLTGAGFGGAVVAVCDADGLVAVGENAMARYRAETGLRPQAFTCRAVDGAGDLVRLPPRTLVDKPG